MATNKNYAIALKPITTVNGEIPAGTILVMENDPGGWSFMKEPVLKYALAIKDLNERLKFGQSAEQQSFILQLKVGDHVKVPNGSFTFNNKNFLRGYVKHKVYVNELGPGLHFVVASSVIFVFTKEIKLCSFALIVNPLLVGGRLLMYVMFIIRCMTFFFFSTIGIRADNRYLYHMDRNSGEEESFFT